MNDSDGAKKNMKPMLTQCCVCKRIKDEKGQYKVFLPVCPSVLISHGYCEDCIKDLYQDED